MAGRSPWHRQWQAKPLGPEKEGGQGSRRSTCVRTGIHSVFLCILVSDIMKQVWGEPRLVLTPQNSIALQSGAQGFLSRSSRCLKPHPRGPASLPAVVRVIVCSAGWRCCFYCGGSPFPCWGPFCVDDSTFFYCLSQEGKEPNHIACNHSTTNYI